MNIAFSHLVWLGAGSATEPSGLLNGAKQATLIEAREEACQELHKKFPQPNIQIRQNLVNITSGNEQFTEYNLAEFSAIRPITGLKALFPGIKIINREPLTCISIADLINELSLTGNNNALVLDIPDLALDLLTAISRNDQLRLFKYIHIYTTTEELYQNSTKSVDISCFLEQQGYVLQKMDASDPELTWMSFQANPLHTDLDEIRRKIATLQKANDALVKEMEQLRLELGSQLQIRDSVFSEIGVDKAEIDRIQKPEQEHSKDYEKLKNSLDQTSKHAIVSAEKIFELEKENRRLLEKNDQMEKQQNALKKELLKAEAQLELIKGLIPKK